MPFRRRARDCPQRLALNLVSGVEISTVWENHEIHIVGLNIDIDHPALTAFLQEQKTRRNQRAEMIGERLEKAHIPGALEGAQKMANGGAVTRGHFARFWSTRAKRRTWRTSLKSIWHAVKPDTFRHSGCTIKQAIDVIIILAVRPCWPILGGIIFLLNG